MQPQNDMVLRAVFGFVSEMSLGVLELLELRGMIHGWKWEADAR